MTAARFGHRRLLRALTAVARASLAQIWNSGALPHPHIAELPLLNHPLKSQPHRPHREMDPDAETRFEFPAYFRVFKSGRIERFAAAEFVPPSLGSSAAAHSKDVAIDPANGVSARLFIPAKKAVGGKLLPILVYFHGGAFCIGSPFSPAYHSYLGSLVAQANVVAVAVGYRLATEHPLPAAYDDSWAAIKWALSPGSDAWLAEHGDCGRVFLAGDSAGGNIAHRMAMRLGEEGLEIEGVALVHPYFWGREAVGSETADAGRREWMEELWRVVNAPGVGADDPWINPMAEGAPSLEGLGCRRALVAVAECDVLAERGRAYCEALKGSGWRGEAELLVAEGEGHCFHLKDPECAKALEQMAKLVAFFGH